MKRKSLSEGTKVLEKELQRVPEADFCVGATLVAGVFPLLVYKMWRAGEEPKREETRAKSALVNCMERI